MNILDRYIGRTVLGGTLLALFVLLSLVTFIAFIDELGDLGEGVYGLWEITQFILMTLPRRAYELIPTATLLGALLGLGTLANNHELIAMRAAGISKARIVGSVLKAGFVVIILTFLLGEFAVPKMETKAQALRAKATADKLKGTEYGFFARDGLTFINIRNVLSGGKLHDVYIYEVDEHHRMRVSTHAKSAYFDQNQETWVLENIEQSYLTEDRVKTKHLDNAQWGSLLDPNLIRFVVVEPESLSVHGLWSYSHYLENNGQDALRYRLAMWSKLTVPLDILLLLILSIPFVLGSMRSVSIGQRILIGTLLGICFFLVDKALNHIGLVYNLSPIVAVLSPIAMFSGLAVWLMRRTY